MEASGANSISNKSASGANSISNKSASGANSISNKSASGANSISNKSASGANSISNKSASSANSISNKSASGANSISNKSASGGISTSNKSASVGISTSNKSASGGISDSANKSVLFVCLGNICRSPIAEAVFRKMAMEAGVVGDWHIDSAATSPQQAGNRPDARALACLSAHQTPVKHVARQVNKEDLARFDHVLCMDRSNLSHVKKKAKVAKECRAKVELLGSYDPVKPGTIIQDPYGGNHEDFETVYKQCVRSCRAFLERNM